MLKKPKYDLRKLIPLVCCETKWHPIYMTMASLNDDELQTFYNELTAIYSHGSLPLPLEQEFRTRLNNE
jgi:hypothetical protein